jgi:hypothetical protein
MAGEIVLIVVLTLVMIYVFAWVIHVAYRAGQVGAPTNS